MFLKFKGALLIFSLTMCTLVSCVEDERNPFENTDGLETGEVFDVKLPGMGDFYVGTEIELRGNGFTADDEIYVTNVDNSSLQAQARVTRYTADKLFFTMPGGAVEYGGNVEVSLVRNGEWHTLGTLYVNNFGFSNMAFDYSRGGEYVEIRGEYADGDRAYYQDMDNYGQLLGQPVEIDLEPQNYGDDTYYEDIVITSAFYPLTNQYMFVYEHNGETAIEEQMGNVNPIWPNQHTTNVGKTVFVEWRGFKAGDKVLISPDGGGIENAVATIDNPIIEEGGLAFEVPNIPEMHYEILLQRYEGHATIIGYLDILNNN